MRLLQPLADRRGTLFPFVPVFLAVGIGGYFALPVEPPPSASWGMVGLASALFLVNRLLPEECRPILAAFGLVLFGLGYGAIRTQIVAAPVLEYRYYGAVEGRVVAVDRSFSDAPRILLDQVWLDHRDAPPRRVRVSLHSPDQGALPKPGERVAVTAHLSPPPAPSEPGGFNFQRNAWFQQLGGVGYARTPMLRMAPASGHALFVPRWRRDLSLWIQDQMPGKPGAFATAILTGDRAAIPQDVLQALRDTNLAHLLAISGLHMGLLSAFIFGAVRYGMSLWPRVALRLDVKKLSACVALVAAAVYLMASGGNVATQRAFVMVAVMLTAILLDRRALTLQSVAIAALIVLLRTPEALTQPGFQMSFAATTGLVWVFGQLRDWPETRWRLPRWSAPITAVILSSAVAGAATAPVAAAHFNQIAPYGLIANVLCVPMMGVLVIPAAVVAALLAPFGLSWVGFFFMRWGIFWILTVAEVIAGWDGAVRHVVAPGPLVIPLFAAGALWLMLWGRRSGALGLLPMAGAALLWQQAERPVLLISENGGLLGVMTPEGRALNKSSGEAFVAQSWLENDGDGATPVLSAKRAGFEHGQGTVLVTFEGDVFVHLYGRGWADRLPQACATGTVVMARRLENPPEGCKILDQSTLSKTGALAFYKSPQGLRRVGAKEAAGDRPWTR